MRALRRPLFFVAIMTVHLAGVAAAEAPAAQRLGFRIDLMVMGFFERIDQHVGVLAPHYPQLVDWNVSSVGENERGLVHSGKNVDLAARRLSYSHAVTPTTSADYRDRFGANGCEIYVAAYTEDEWRRVQGAGITTHIFGKRMGPFHVVASVITEKPQVPELERQLTMIIQEAANVAATAMSSHEPTQ